MEDDPETAFGKREGQSVYITKIPFRAKRCLEEKDPKMRRYLYCHCPWARESILSQEGAFLWSSAGAAPAFIKRLGRPYSKSL
ncbi:MAG: hypothetical protein MZU97_27145 [Bacillus subtilis]|nr:hypothetical protein [Bacillus subtilis]